MSSKTRLLSARTSPEFRRALKNEPAAKEASAVAQTINPRDLQRLSSDSPLWFVFMGSILLCCCSCEYPLIWQNLDCHVIIKPHVTVNRRVPLDTVLKRTICQLRLIQSVD